MTDRELLELAAKAAGLKLIPFGTVPMLDQEGEPYWNPLNDDGDALRLAVKLELVLCVMSVGFTGIYLPAEHIGGKYDVVEVHKGDPIAATRRAIVKAAAEIGRGMK